MYIGTYILDVAALLYLIGLLYSDTSLNNNRKKPFLISIILTIVVILSEVGTILNENGSINLLGINVLCNVLGFALTPIIPIILTLIFDTGIIRKHRILLAPTLINVVATMLSPFFGFIFSIDANNCYFRGDYFLIFISAYFINLLFLVINTLDAGKKYNYPIVNKLVMLSLFTTIGTSIQLIIPSAYISWHCVIFATVLSLDVRV